jgi:hypothetical protein
MVDLVNNLIRNFDDVGTEIHALYDYSPRANIIGNVYENGVPGIRPIGVRVYEGMEVADGSFFVADNLSDFTPALGGDDWNIMGHESRPDLYATDRSKQRMEPWPVAAEYAVTEDSPEELVELLSAHVGASYPTRDPLDTRLVTEAMEGTGDCGTGSPDDHEELPVLVGGTAPIDSDGDGMSDLWEKRQRLIRGRATGTWIAMATVTATWMNTSTTWWPPVSTRLRSAVGRLPRPSWGR